MPTRKQANLMEKREDSERDWKASNLHLKETVVDCFTLWLGGGGATQLPDKSYRVLVLLTNGQP